jgi:hypothetical protein
MIAAGHGAWGMICAEACVVLAEGDVAHPLIAIFNMAVSADSVQKARAEADRLLMKERVLVRFSAGGMRTVTHLTRLVKPGQAAAVRTWSPESAVWTTHTWRNSWRSWPVVWDCRWVVKGLNVIGIKPIK